MYDNTQISYGINKEVIPEKLDAKAFERSLRAFCFGLSAFSLIWTSGADSNCRKRFCGPSPLHSVTRL